MKQFYFLFILFFSSQMLLAQSQELVWQDKFISKGYKIKHSAIDNSWVIAGSEHQNPTVFIPQAHSYLIKIDSLGNEVWRKSNIVAGEVTSVLALDILSNGNIILIPNLEGCDFGYPDSLFQFNSNGIEISKIPLAYNYLQDIKVLNGDKILLAYQQQLTLLDVNLNLLWTHTMNDWSTVSHLQQAPNGTIFYFTDDGIWKIDESTGNPLDSLTASNPAYHTSAQIGEHFYIMNANRDVVFMDTSFNFGFAAFNISNEFDVIYKAEGLSPNEVFILGKKNGKMNIKSFNSGFGGLDSVSNLDIQHIYINDFAVSGQQISITGGDFSEVVPNNHEPYYFVQDISKGSSTSIFKTFDHSLQSNNSGLDIGIVDINFDNATSTFGNCSYDYYNHAFTNVKVTVKNHGSQPVNNFKIYLREDASCPSFCVVGVMQSWTFDNLNLAPNDSIELSLQDVNIALQSPTNAFDLCFWTGESNNKIDINHSNDKYCISTQTVNTKGIALENTLPISPNPAQNSIQLSIPNNIQNGNIEIYNLEGKLIFTKMNMANDNNWLVNVSTLANGFYVLKFRGENGKLLIGKFIKQ